MRLVVCGCAESKIFLFQRWLFCKIKLHNGHYFVISGVFWFLVDANKGSNSCDIDIGNHSVFIAFELRLINKAFWNSLRTRLYCFSSYNINLACHILPCHVIKLQIYLLATGYYWEAFPADPFVVISDIGHINTISLIDCWWDLHFTLYFHQIVRDWAVWCGFESIPALTVAYISKTWHSTTLSCTESLDLTRQTFPLPSYYKLYSSVTI